jgi:hypothetical protein
MRLPEWNGDLGTIGGTAGGGAVAGAGVGAGWAAAGTALATRGSRQETFVSPGLRRERLDHHAPTARGSLPVRKRNLPCIISLQT